MTIIGLDISKWQGKLTAATVAAMRAQNVQFCGVKVSQGTGHEDPQWRNSVPLLQAGGIKVYPYHFTTTDRADLQSGWFLSLIDSVEWDLPPAMDCEAYTAVGGELYGISELRNLPQAQQQFIRAAMAQGVRMGEIEGREAYALWSLYGLSYPTEATVDAIGRELIEWMLARPKLAAYQYPEIYTNSASGNKIFKSPSMKRYSLWVANWGTTTPLLPTVWKGQKYMIWQDNVVAGEPYGIAGKVDHDVWGNLFDFPVEDEPEPEPDVNEIAVTIKDAAGNVWAGKLQEQL